MTDLYDKIERLSHQAERDLAMEESQDQAESGVLELHQLTREPPPPAEVRRPTLLRLME